MDSDSEWKLRSLISIVTSLSQSDMESKLEPLTIQIISLVRSMELDSQPKPESSEMMSLVTQAVSVFNSMDLDSQPKPMLELISHLSRKISLDDTRDSSENFVSLVSETFDLEPEPELISAIQQILSLVISTQPPGFKIISLLTQLMSLDDTTDSQWYSISDWDVRSYILKIASLVRSMDLDSQPKPETEFMSLVTQTISLIHSMDLNSEPEPLSELIQFITGLLCPRDSEDSHWLMFFDMKPLLTEISELEPVPEFLSLIHQIFSLVITMNSKWKKKLISLCPQAQVSLENGKFIVDAEFQLMRKKKLACLPLNGKKFKLAEREDTTFFVCERCNGENHKGYKNAPVEIKHPLHPKHYLRLVSFEKYGATRECYCCDKDLIKVFYHCSACDVAINIACVEKPPVLSIEHPKWHEHTLALFPRHAFLTCNVCAMADSTSPIYMCPPCDFVVHQKCISLPRVIKISRHLHRISFTQSFEQGDWLCSVCRKKIDNDYGGYSCIKEGCSYAAHSRCATQSNVWDGIELEGEPEDIEEEELEPFVQISDGVIQHFSHNHHLILDEDTSRDYDENKLCQACITPIYFGNFYSCMQCDFILHDACANFSRKIFHPIHPHLLTLALVGGNDDFVRCSACPWLITAGFLYECNKDGCSFRLHVQCATISEPLVHESHMHPLFLTSKPEEKRTCSVCEQSMSECTNETFNCIECDYFSLCFECATLPQKVRYKHDKHMLTLSYGDETSTLTYWCEACEEKIHPKKRFYRCDEYGCVTLHIKCLIGKELYMKPDSSFFYMGRKIYVLPNNQHMTRPICRSCMKRCPQKVVFFHHRSLLCCINCVLRSIYG